MTKKLYTILDVKEDATINEIKTAWRKKSHENHPDKNDGKDEEQKTINQAYAILKDPEKRKEYDETGSVNSRNQDPNLLAYELIAGLLGEYLKAAGSDVIYLDVIKDLRTELYARIKKGFKERRKIKDGVQSLILLRSRFSCDESAQGDPIGSYFASLLRNNQKVLERIEVGLRMNIIARHILVLHHFKHDEKKVSSSGTWSATLSQTF